MPKSKRPAKRTSKPAKRVTAPLPSSYGQDLIVLQTRDPRWLHAYWELRPETVETGMRRLGESAGSASWILRVYEEGSSRWPHHLPYPPEVDLSKKWGPSAPRQVEGWFDVEFGPGSTDWHFQAQPDREWSVEIGLKDRNGRFVPLARSNWARTPPEGPSDAGPSSWLSPP